MKTPQKLAPIALFVYNRLDHTKQTIEALKLNTLAEESDLIIFSDAAKNEKASLKVGEVRKYIHSVTGFKNITVVERSENFGLAKSISTGVTDIVNKYGKIIVLEDDIVTSPAFLKFMNEALDYHQNNQKVWHISGWSYPINTEGLSDTFLWRGMNCWGWATWVDRWKYFKKDTNTLITEFNSEKIHTFNIDGTADFWGQVLANQSGKTNTWAVFWYASIFKNKGLCLNPSQTFVTNIGHDGTGVHLGEDESFNSKVNTSSNVSYEVCLEENEIALSRIKSFYKKQARRYPIKVIKKIFRIGMQKLGLR